MLAMLEVDRRRFRRVGEGEGEAEPRDSAERNSGELWQTPVSSGEAGDAGLRMSRKQPGQFNTGVTACPHYRYIRHIGSLRIKKGNPRASLL